MRITTDQQEHLPEAIRHFLQARQRVALTGAGISVESGIADFRSPGGLWSHYPPDEYATLSVFRSQPEKAWKLFRALGKSLQGKQPNVAHRTLAELEKRGFLHGIVTQNIDNLHQDAGSETVLEIHGNHGRLHCLRCDSSEDATPEVLESDTLPCCKGCRGVLKPDVVLFEENVRCLHDIELLLNGCDLLIVIGTSAQVYPAASIPAQVKYNGGKIYEFNIHETVLTQGETIRAGITDYFFQGQASSMMHLFLNALIRG